MDHLDFLPNWIGWSEGFRRFQQLDTGRSFRSLQDLSKVMSETECSRQQAVSEVGDKAVALMHAMDRAVCYSCFYIFPC
ncbi:unnamed protein product [Protopolystoma xenopodis]|uniref:Uncharacterized protein n=1 Tax=Protopolystoma xenopodis TaxID=117903 RepID=A0A448XLM4_9PLAT|nr:unnamed protein product [Protopolystoma xenopodis]